MKNTNMESTMYNEAVSESNAALWFLGQAGYYIKCCGQTILIDPYLSDSVGKSAPLFSRAYPPPVDPAKIKADIFIVTHDHMDHLDSETIEAYGHKDTTVFVSPRFASEKLKSLDVPNRVIVDHGVTVTVNNVQITGVFALATGADTLDTCGYLITFPNGKSVYHTSDTAYCGLLLDACPKEVDVLLTCINGKFGNLNIAEAVRLTQAVNPKYVIPNHYDVMALNAENPESFCYFCQDKKVDAECVILPLLGKFTW